MATRITKVNDYNGLSGSPEKRVDTAPDGTLWLVLSQSRDAKFFYSKNGGSTWEYAYSSDVDMDVGTTEGGIFPSLFIDKEGYAHLSYALTNRNPQAIVYMRGTPLSGGVGWKWSAKLLLTPGLGSLSANTDVVAFRNGSGWVAWVSWSTFGSTNSRAKVSRVNISSTGSISTGAVNFGPPDMSGDYRMHALEFHHTGDGKTPTATPHLYLVACRTGSTLPLYGWRAAYTSGTWTWEAVVTLDATSVTGTRPEPIVQVFDGDRVCVFYANVLAPRFLEWTPGGAIVQRNPPAFPAGVTGKLLANSLAHDPATDDLYAVAYGSGGDVDAFWSKLTRSTGTWSAWTKAVDRTLFLEAGGEGQARAQEGKVQLVRHAPKDAVDLIYGTPDSDGTKPWSIYHHQLSKLTRAPAAPKLGVPANGERLDLAAGATFTWAHTRTGASDRQQAWAFRRKVGATASYWNQGSKLFQATEVWNAGAAAEVSFDPGVWANGSSYPWTVRTRSSTGQDSPYAAERTVIATAKPTVTVTEPGGLIFTESTPLVEWIVGGPDPQRDYEVRVFIDSPTVNPDVDTPVWSSGLVTSSAFLVRVGEPLTDGLAYRVFVRVTSTSGLVSDWASSAFSLTLLPPSGPLVQVSPEWSYPTEVPRARLRVTARSNLLDADQALGIGGWQIAPNGNQADSNIHTDETAPVGVEPGLKFTPVTADSPVSFQTVLGDPPLVPEGEVQPLGPLNFPVVGDQEFTALAHFRAQDVPRASRVIVRWFADDIGVDTHPIDAISSAVSEQVVTSSQAYSMAAITAVAPGNAKRATIALEVLGMAAGEVHYATRISFHPGAEKRWQPGGFAGTQTVRVERSDDGGTTWAEVPGLGQLGVDAYQRATVRDRRMPLGKETRYRAFTDVQSSSGTRLTSASSPVGAVTIDTDAWVLRDLQDPAGEVVALVTGWDKSDEDAAVVHRPIGRVGAVVDTEGAQSATGSLDIYVPGYATTQTIELLRRGVPILVQTPLGERFTAYFLSRDYEAQVAAARTISASYVEV